MGCRCNHGEDCHDGHVALGSRCSSDSNGASEALLSSSSSRREQHENEGSECDEEEEDLDEDDETRGLCSGGGGSSDRRTRGAQDGESAGDDSDDSSISEIAGTVPGNNTNQNDADDVGEEADRTSGSGVGCGDASSEAGLLAGSGSGVEEVRSGGGRKGSAVGGSVTGSRRRSSENRSRGSGHFSARGRGSCVSSSAVHVLLEEQHSTDEQGQHCFDGRTFFSRLAHLFSRVVFCGSTRFRKGCSMVSCSSGSSGRSAAAASSPPLEVVAAVTPPAAPTAGVLIRVAGTAPSSSSLSAECFSSPLSLDTDASERLLPRPARAAAARAAAAAAAAGGGDGSGAGGGVAASGTVLQRRFLTLHRRRRRRPAAPMAPHKALLDDLYPGPTQSVLDRVGEWDFNAFALDSVSGGRPVSVLCVYLLYKYDLINAFRMDTVTVWKCFSLIEDGYHTTNPYHNAVHAADVTQAMHCYLQEPEINRHLTPLEALAALLAAVCHDLDHPGVNQPFLIATDNHLAALYKNLSVLENHHWRCAMGCLWESGLLQGWPAEAVAQLQDQIRSLILATDITRQQEFLTKFKKYQETSSMKMEDAECRHFSLQIALKCADICNPCRPWGVSKKWSQKICDEFYRQGDYERQLNIPVTSLCDRYTTTVAKIQTGFIQFVVCPLFGAWHQWLDTGLSSTMMKNLKTNLVKWQEILDEDAAKAAACNLPSKQQKALPSAKADDAEEPSEADPITAGSSSDSSTDTVGNLGQSIACAPQTVVGRRHSLPLNVPSMLPRTVIRRESLSSDGQYPIVLETVQMEGMSLSTLSQADSTSPGDSELVSMMTKLESSPPSIPRHSQTKSGRRRMSLPQLTLAHHQRYKQQISTLQPLPATPSLEELRLPGNLQVSSAVGGGGGPGQGPSSSQQSQESQKSACQESSTKNQSVCVEEVSSSSCGGGDTFGLASRRCDAPDSTAGDSVGTRTDNNPSERGNGAKFPSNKLSSSSVSCVLPPSSTNPFFSANKINSGKESQNQPMVSCSSATSGTPSRFSRRASLDSSTCCTNLNSNDNLNLVHQQNLLNNLNNLSSSAANLKNCSNSNANFNICEELAAIVNSNHNSKLVSRRGVGLLDKENRAPPTCSKARASLLARTRHWRSLTQDDDGDIVRSGHTKLPYSQVNPSLRGRRGSAPVLQVDAMHRAPAPRLHDCDIPTEVGHANLSRRRASAPTNHLLQGILDNAASRLQPSMQLQHLQLAKLRQRTDADYTSSNSSSHPSDLPASVASRLGLEPQCGNAPAMAVLATRGSFGSSTAHQGTGCGGGGHHRYGGGLWTRDPPDGGSLPFRDAFRRGSVGMDGLPDMWRYRQECGVSQDSSDDMGDPDWYSSSGGAVTPSTPGCAPFILHPSVYPPHQPIRRGSLPCDFSFSGDLRMLETS